MSQFYASIKGNRGEATRQGTKQSGISGHIRGWEIGARVVIEHVDGYDEVSIYLTSGSNGRTCEKHLGTFTVEDIYGRK